MSSERAPKSSRLALPRNVHVLCDRDVRVCRTSRVVVVAEQCDAALSVLAAGVSASCVSGAIAGAPGSVSVTDAAAPSTLVPSHDAGAAGVSLTTRLSG